MKTSCVNRLPFFARAGRAKAVGLLLALVAWGRVLSSTAWAELPRISATDTLALREHVGQEVVVEGTVLTIGRTADGRITFLNFGPRNSGTFVGVIFDPAYVQFPDGFDHFLNQAVEIQGFLHLYEEETPQIRIDLADQIRLRDAEESPTAEPSSE